MRDGRGDKNGHHELSAQDHRCGNSDPEQGEKDAQRRAVAGERKREHDRGEAKTIGHGECAHHEGEKSVENEGRWCAGGGAGVGRCRQIGADGGKADGVLWFEPVDHHGEHRCRYGSGAKGGQEEGDRGSQEGLTGEIREMVDVDPIAERACLAVLWRPVEGVLLLLLGLLALPDLLGVVADHGRVSGARNWRDALETKKWLVAPHALAHGVFGEPEMEAECGDG